MRRPRAPLFLKKEADQLKAFIRQHVRHGDKRKLQLDPAHAAKGLPILAGLLATAALTAEATSLNSAWPNSQPSSLKPASTRSVSWKP